MNSCLFHYFTSPCSAVFDNKVFNLLNLRNLGQNGFPVLPHKGLKTVVELKAHNNPALKDFPLAEVLAPLM